MGRFMQNAKYYFLQHVIYKKMKSWEWKKKLIFLFIADPHGSSIPLLLPVHTSISLNIGKQRHRKQRKARNEKEG